MITQQEAIALRDGERQLTEEEAIAIADSGHWNDWSDEEIARFQLHQDRLAIPFNRFHEAVTKALGRDVWTHEFAFRQRLIDELNGLRQSPTLSEVIDLIPAEKTNDRSSLTHTPTVSTMPNHIQNRLQVIGESSEVQKLFDHIKGQWDNGEPMQIDFNTITPMPEELEVNPHSGIEMWVKLCTGQIDFSSILSSTKISSAKLFLNGHYEIVTQRLAAQTVLEYLIGERSGNVKDFTEEEFNQFIQCLKNYRTTGYISWYEWSIDNWGTKWNAYDQNDARNTEDTIYFQTAWSSPKKLILELSSMFPAVKIALTYADENAGSNTGRILFEAGAAIEIEQPERQSKEGFAIFFELHPDSIQYYRPVGDTYEYVEEEEIEEEEQQK